MGGGRGLAFMNQASWAVWQLRVHTVGGPQRAAQLET